MVHTAKLSSVLGLLDVAESLGDISLSSFKLYLLKGKLKGEPEGH